MLLRKILIVLFLGSICLQAFADVFVVKKIRINGLQRISRGTVLSYMPIKIGDKIDTTQASYIIHELYDTNFFSNITLKRNGNNLIVNVVEREVISSLNISGNVKLKKKQLVEALKNNGIAEGQEFNPAILNSIKQAISQQYLNLGLYRSKVNISVKPQKRNRVAISINVKEGPTAKIKSIKIVGNKSFTERTLLKEFSLSTTKLWSFLTNSDQYSKERLDADLEKLRSFYMNHGHLHIKIDKTKVSITPDGKGIYVVINITEGSVYKISGFDLKGNLIGKKEEIAKLVTCKAGDIFSRKNITETKAKISNFLGEHGYGMPDFNVKTKINEKTKTVRIKFAVNPGQRVYIRQINFKGNHKTNDEVLRREMRLQEGGLLSLAKINESHRRLANLGYLQDVNYKIIPIEDANNQVDLVYEVKEVSAITANFQAGISDRDGFIYGANLKDENVLGTGKTALIRFDNSKATRYYGIGYYDPYFTINKIGLSINGYFSKIRPNKINSELSSYSKNIYGTTISFDAPLSDYTQINFGFGFEHIEIGRASNPNPKAEKFFKDHGGLFNQFKLMLGLNYSKLDRAIFPTKGFAHTISLEGNGPLNVRSLEYYKLNYNATWYQPLYKSFILRFHTELGYGDGLGKTKKLPFFANFFAGGMDSVRGFEPNTLSDEGDKDKAIGGNILTTANASLILPSPFESIRPSIFVDVGNVYDNYFKPDELRASCGLQVEWRTPILPLKFSVAIPIHKKSWDETSVFNFSVSTGI